MMSDGRSAATSTNPDPASAPGERCRVREVVDGTMGPARAGAVEAALARRDGEVVWIDLTNPGEQTLAALEGTFHLHPLIMEDLTERHRTSDMRVFDGTTFAILRCPHPGVALGFDEIQVITGDGYLVTVQHGRAVDLDALLPRWEQVPASWRSTSGSLVPALLRLAVDRFAPVVARLESRLDAVQRLTLHPRRAAPPRGEIVNTLFELTEQLTDLHTTAVSTMEVIHGIRHNSDSLAQEAGSAYASDVLDDARYLAHRLDTLLDTAGRLFDMVNALISLHQADVGRQLTLVATIFLPLTLISSYFGQNFRFMIDGINSRWDFLFWGMGAQLISLAVIMGVLWKVGAFR